MKKIALILLGIKHTTDLTDLVSRTGYTISETITAKNNKLPESFKHKNNLVLLYTDAQSLKAVNDSLNTLMTSQMTPLVVIVDHYDQYFFKQAETMNIHGVMITPITDSQFKASVEMAVQSYERCRLSKQNYNILHSSLEKANVAIRVIDDNFKIVLANNAYAQLHQKPLEDIINSDCCCYLSSNQCKTEQCSFVQIQKGKKLIDDIVELPTSKNKIKHFHYTIFPLAWKGNPVKYIVEVFRDITSIIEKDKKISRLDTLYMAVFNNSQIPIFFSNINGNIVDINDAFLELFGYSKDELKKNNISNLYVSQRQRKELLIKIKKEGFFKEVSVQVKAKNGEIKIVSASGTLIKVNGEQLTLGIIVDKTEQYRIEEALRESEERLSLAIEATSDALWDWDYQTGKAYFSPQWFTMLGYEVNEFPSSYSSIERLCHPDDLPIANEAIRTHINQDTSGFETEFRLKGKDQEWHWILSRGKVFSRNEEGTPLRIIGTNIKIDDRKQFEQKLDNAKKDAERANKSKSVFLSNMSHELRTPLNTIIGFSQILKMDTEKSNKSKQEEFLNYIMDAGNHLLEMVNDILDLSKIEAGKTEIQKVPFDICKMLDRSPSTIQALAKSKVIDMSTNIPSNLGWLSGDEVRIKQVIYNLLSNAIKFTPSGKKIGIDAAFEEEILKITIWDEGPGIAPENIEEIFEPFKQIKNKHVENSEGTGLGLPISRKLIELHEGTLTVQSNPGQGSSFTIALPGRIDKNTANKQKENDMKDLKASHTITNWLSILVIDDNFLNARVISEALAGQNCAVDTASTGEEALQYTASKKYDIILMDIQLPGMNGIETMIQLKKKLPHPPPIIALTAFAMKGDKQFYLDEGFNDYLSKPINIEHLLSAIIDHTGEKL